MRSLDKKAQEHEARAKATATSAHEEAVKARRIAKIRLSQLSRVHTALVVPLMAWLTKSGSASVSAAARSLLSSAGEQADSLCESEAQAAWLAAAQSSVLELAGRSEDAGKEAAEAVANLEAERHRAAEEREEAADREAELLAGQPGGLTSFECLLPSSIPMSTNHSPHPPFHLPPALRDFPCKYALAVNPFFVF